MYKFNKYPYLKLNLKNMNFPMNTIIPFKKTFDYLPNDSYIKNHTRSRLYRNYLIENINNDFIIKPTYKNTFTQEVPDSRKKLRVFELIREPMNPFLINFLTMSSNLLNMNHPFKKISVDVHQVRQICYPDIKSHNSMEGIHQDGADYIISACVLNRYNIEGGVSSIYDSNIKLLDEFTLKENDFIFQDDKNLYHYVTPIQYTESNSYLGQGYRDIIGIDIKIL